MVSRSKSDWLDINQLHIWRHWKWKFCLDRSQELRKGSLTKFNDDIPLGQACLWCCSICLFTNWDELGYTFFFTYTRSRAVTSAISRHEAVTVTVPKPDQTGMLPLGKLWLVHKHICELHWWSHQAMEFHPAELHIFKKHLFKQPAVGFFIEPAKYVYPHWYPVKKQNGILWFI